MIADVVFFLLFFLMHKHFPYYYSLCIHFLHLFFFPQHFTMKNFKLETEMKIFYRQCHMSSSRLGCYHLFSLWAFIEVPAYVSPLLSLGTQQWIKERTCLHYSEYLWGWGVQSVPYSLLRRGHPFRGGRSERRAISADRCSW